MPEYDNTDNPREHALDYESWEICFEAYERYPVEALMLGFNIMVLKAFLLVEPPRLAEAIEGLDKAMEVLFNHSQFHEVAYEMFRKVAGGKLTYEEEQILKSLGLIF
jgi:hypothetical protein